MLCGSSISSGALLICISPFPKCKARPAGRRNRERVICSSRWGQLSVHSENGADELVCVALVVPQDLLHSVSVPGAGRVAHRQRQQFMALVVPALHGANLLSSLSVLSIGHSAISSCAAGRHSGTAPEPRRSRHPSNPEPDEKSKCSAPAPADWQRRRQPVRC